MKRTFFHCTSSRSASSARRSRSEVCRAISGRSSVELARGAPRHQSLPRLAQRAVDDEIRIAPDRRREVRVARRPPGRSARDSDGSYRAFCIVRSIRKAIGFSSGVAAHPLDQLLEVPRRDGVRAARRGCSRAWRRTPRTPRPSADRAASWMRYRRRHVVIVEMLRDRLVRHEHELLDDPVRDVALRRDDLLDHALVVEHDLRLLQIEVDRSAAAPPLVEDLEQLAHRLEHRHEAAGTSRSSAGSCSVRMALTSVYVIRASLWITPSCIS